MPAHTRVKTWVIGSSGIQSAVKSGKCNKYGGKGKVWRHGLKMGNMDIDDASKYLSFYAMLLLGAIIILFIFQ